MPEKNIVVDPNNASYWFGKMETQILGLIDSQKSFQFDIEKNIDEISAKYIESYGKINEINIKLQKLDNKIDDTKNKVEMDVLKKQKNFLIAIGSAVLSIICTIVSAYFIFKAGLK